MDILIQLYFDDRGFIVSIELLLIVTILVIGLVAGLATLRDAINAELNDVGAAVRNLNQSFDSGDPFSNREEPVFSTFTEYQVEPDGRAKTVDNCVQVFGFNDR